MALLINDRKVKAAANSMHQFCQQVRTIFPGEVDDRAVEAATAYLYISLVRDLFGNRFAVKLQRRLYARLKYSTPAEVEGHIARITKHSEVIERTEDNGVEDTPEEAVRAHVMSVIEAILSDAGFQGRDPEITRRAYVRFEEAVKEIRDHLLGIRDQNNFLMRTRAPAARG